MVKIWNCDSMQCEQVINTGFSVSALKLRCTHVAVGLFFASATLWTLLTGEVVGRYVGHVSAVFSINFNLFFDIFVTGSADRTVILWSLKNQTPLQSIVVCFKPSSVQLVFPSAIPRQSNTFLLIANDFNLCKVHLVSFCDGDIVVSDAKLPLETFDVTHTHTPIHTVGVDVVSNMTLVLARSLFGRIREYCISFKHSDHTGESDIKCNSSALTGESENVLDVCRRDVLVDSDKQLLAAGSCFSVYMHWQGEGNKLVIVRHTSSSQSESVRLWHLPNKRRWE